MGFLFFETLCMFFFFFSPFFPNIAKTVNFLNRKDSYCAVECGFGCCVGCSKLNGGNFTHL